MTGRQGKEVTGLVQCCAINKCHCGKASMTSREENRLQVQCSILL